MKDIKIQCDRCGKMVDGGIDKNGMTAGYYIVSEGNWKEFARWEEEYVCTQCMGEDPKYKKIYNIGNVI